MGRRLIVQIRVPNSANAQVAGIPPSPGSDADDERSNASPVGTNRSSPRTFRDRLPRIGQDPSRRPSTAFPQKKTLSRLSKGQATSARSFEAENTLSSRFRPKETAPNAPDTKNVPLTPPQREEYFFRRHHLAGLGNVDARIERILKKNVPLPAEFFDGRRPPVESLSACLRLQGIECSPNDAHPSLNFITAVIAAMTGVHGKNDMSAATDPVFDHDRQVHTAEALRVLARVNQKFPALAHTAIGSMVLDPRASDEEKAADNRRMDFLLKFLGGHAGKKFNVNVLDIESGRPTRGKQLTHLSRPLKIAGEEPSSECNVYLVYDRTSGRFLPLREREVLTNPFLATTMRYRKKSLAGRFKSNFADWRRPFSARVKARQMSDAMLYEKAVDNSTAKPRIMGKDRAENEYIKEWLKRTDPDYKLKKQARLPTTRFQKIKSALPFTLNRPSDDQYLGRPTPDLVALLNHMDDRRDRKDRMRIKKAIYRNFLLSKQPAVLNPLPPTPVLFTSPHLVKAVLADFDALLQPGGDPARSPLADARLAEFRLLLSVAQDHIVDGFKTGDQHRMALARSVFKQAVTKFVRDGVLPPQVRRQLERLADSIGDLYVGPGPLPAHERTAEMADVLRRCGHAQADIDRFSTAIEPIVAQRRAARQTLQGFLRNDAMRRGESAETMRLIGSMPDEKLSVNTFRILVRQTSDLADTLARVKQAKDKIDDFEKNRATAHPDPAVAQTAASMLASQASRNDVERKKARLNTRLVRLTTAARQHQLC